MERTSRDAEFSFGDVRRRQWPLVAGPSSVLHRSVIDTYNSADHVPTPALNPGRPEKWIKQHPLADRNITCLDVLESVRRRVQVLDAFDR
jgi:hypothetical protein